MTYSPHTDEDIRIMLSRIGVPEVESLFVDIPKELRYPELKIEPALSELEAAAHLSTLARKNRSAQDGPWFLGGGIYHHYIPAVVPALSSRGEFATSYTPYQPEVSQGTLQAIFEYQSMLVSPTGMAAANASHFDGATALAEAIAMAVHAAGSGPKIGDVERVRVLLPSTLNPWYRHTIDAYLSAYELDIELYEGQPASALGKESGGRASEGKRPDGRHPGDAGDHAKTQVKLAALVVQWPDFEGRLWDLEGLAEKVHAEGGLLIVHADPMMLGLFRSPGSYGADIVSAEGQALGIPMSFGGPALGIMACTQALVRRLPGRIAGQAQDSAGRRGFVLTLSAREQHIRREKAVSNICSNQGLMALSACIYLASLGPRGMAEIGRICWERSHYAAKKITGIPGFSLVHDTMFFKEFLVRTPVPAEALVSQIRTEFGIEAGLPLSRVFPDRGHEVLIAVTELNSVEEIDALIVALQRTSAHIRGGASGKRGEVPDTVQPNRKGRPA